MVNPLVATLQRPLLRRRNARRLAIETPPGVREERFLTINGQEQWITIRGADRANPVLLVLHGGPGASYIPFNSWLTSWERHFTVVQWDQPGAGRTFQRHRDSTGRISLARLAADGVELATQLGELLGHSTSVLLGSSVGSLVGTEMVRRRPDLFAAYVGVNQNSPGSDPTCYQLTSQAARNRDDRPGLRLLAGIGPDPSRWTPEQHEALMKLAIRLTKGVPDMVYDLMLPALMFAPDYTMRDIRDYQRAMEYTGRQLFAELRSFDQRDPEVEYGVPVFFLMGEWDIVTPLDAAREYFQRIRAPRKEFVSIPGAGHLTEFAAPDRVLRELLTRVRPLAAASRAADGASGPRDR